MFSFHCIEFVLDSNTVFLFVLYCHNFSSLYLSRLSMSSKYFFSIAIPFNSCIFKMFVLPLLLSHHSIP